MSRNLDADFLAEKNKQTNKPIFLYTIYNYDGASNDLHFAEHDDDVTYDGTTYLKFPITHDFVSQNTQGQIDSVRVRISNVSRAIQSYLEDYNWAGKKVEIKMVFSDLLADTDAYFKDVFYIDRYTANQQVAEFVLTSKFDLLDLELPTRRYTRTYCQWVFKSTECGYAGAETECNKTFQRCKQLANSERFGGMPAVPTRKVYLV